MPKKKTPAATNNTPAGLQQIDALIKILQEGRESIAGLVIGIDVVEGKTVKTPHGDTENGFTVAIDVPLQTKNGDTDLGQQVTTRTLGLCSRISHAISLRRGPFG